jgi:hypothetical protein
MREKAASVVTVGSKLNLEKSGLIRGRTNSIGLMAERNGRSHYVATVNQGRCSGRNAQVNVGKGERTRIEVKCVCTKIMKNVQEAKLIQATFMN